MRDGESCRSHPRVAKMKVHKDVAQHACFEVPMPTTTCTTAVSCQNAGLSTTIRFAVWYGGEKNRRTSHGEVDNVLPGLSPPPLPGQQGDCEKRPEALSSCSEPNFNPRAGAVPFWNFGKTMAAI